MSKENFKIMRKSNENKNLIYEDSSCIVYCNVADFRDEVCWTTILSVQDKKNTQQLKLTAEQKLEVYRRINYSMLKDLNKHIYVTESGIIEEKPQSLEIPLLDWK